MAVPAPVQASLSLIASLVTPASAPPTSASTDANALNAVKFSSLLKQSSAAGMLAGFSGVLFPQDFF